MNKPANEANDKELALLPAKKYLIKALDNPNPIPATEKICDTGNLVHTLLVCVGARFMLTINIDIDDHLVNGSIGTIVHISMSTSDPLKGILYMKFDNPNAGNARKTSRNNTDWVPIEAVVQTFKRKYKNNQRKQFPGKLAHAITIHKSQGGTFPHMFAYLGGSKSSIMMSKKPGMMYTCLSRCTTRIGIKLEDFNSNMIVTNQNALVEMQRMREEKPFHFHDPTYYFSSPILMLLNIVSWNLHISHHLSDQFYLEKCSIMCFTETNLTNVTGGISRIDNFHTGWKDYHSHTEHGLAICHNESRIKFVKILPVTSGLEGMACMFSDKNEYFIVFLIYRKSNTRIHYFFEQLTNQLDTFAHYEIRIILLGDFNVDQYKDNNHLHYMSLYQQFNLNLMSSGFSTHIHGGALDLIFDTNIDGMVEWLPTPFSDHFYQFYGI